MAKTIKKIIAANPPTKTTLARASFPLQDKLHDSPKRSKVRPMPPNTTKAIRAVLPPDDALFFFSSFSNSLNCFLTLFLDVLLEVAGFSFTFLLEIKKLLFKVW